MTSDLVHDREGWFAGIQHLAAKPYPDELRRAIVAWNHPLLRTSQSSYRHQIELALDRDDPVSLNHRSAALLASVFDIVFALHRTLHPGEKRLLAHVAALGQAIPPAFEQHVRYLLTVSVTMDRGRVLQAVDALCETVDTMIATEYPEGAGPDRPQSMSSRSAPS